MNHDMYLKLREMINTHRSRSLITCDEHCFCWDVEVSTNAFEEKWFNPKDKKADSKEKHC